MKLQFVFLGCVLLAGCETLVLDKPQAPIEKKTDAKQHKKIKKVIVKKKKKTEAQLAKTNIQSSKNKRLPNKKIPQHQSDVWDRIAMQLKMPIPDRKRIEHYRNWYLKNPHHLEIVAMRARPFLYLITEKIEQRNIPIEFALLPIVESSFDQYAYSHGSAAGLWQFVSDTGRRFGLQENWWYDGRRDVEKSTDAAIDLLIYLNDKFNGNWLHALAAYNTGEGRVFKAIRKNIKAGKSTEFWYLDLPKETSSYVPKLLAVADIIKNQKKYGVNLPVINNRPHIKIVQPKKQLDLSVAADYAGISLNLLQDLNPGYNHWSTPPEGPYHLLLPIEAAARFEDNFKKKGNQGFKLTRYQVRSGDSLSQIAQRHKTSVSTLKRANQLTQTEIRIGQHLMIPVTAHQARIQTESVYERMKKRVSRATGKKKHTHTVKNNESLWLIARAHNVKIKDLTRWNNLNKDKPLIKGQKLVIWKKNQAQSKIKTIVYQIKDGDSLSTIAHHHKVRVKDVKRWNDLDENIIHPGQTLTLYIAKSSS